MITYQSIFESFITDYLSHNFESFITDYSSHNYLSLFAEENCGFTSKPFYDSIFEIRLLHVVRKLQGGL